MHFIVPRVFRGGSDILLGRGQCNIPRTTSTAGRPSGHRHHTAQFRTRGICSVGVVRRIRLPCSSHGPLRTPPEWIRLSWRNPSNSHSTRRTTGCLALRIRRGDRVTCRSVYTRHSGGRDVRQSSSFARGVSAFNQASISVGERGKSRGGGSWSTTSKRPAAATPVHFSGYPMTFNRPIRVAIQFPRASHASAQSSARD